MALYRYLKPVSEGPNPNERMEEIFLGMWLTMVPSFITPTASKGISEITRFFLTRQLFVYYGVPDVAVNMVAAYHRLDGERIVLAQRVFQGV